MVHIRGSVFAMATIFVCVLAFFAPSGMVSVFSGSGATTEGLPPNPGCVHYEIADGVYFEKCELPDGVTCYVHVPPFGMTGIAMWCER